MIFAVSFLFTGKLLETLVCFKESSSAIRLSSLKMSSPSKRSSLPAETGPSTSPSSSKRQRIDESESLALPEPNSPPGSPRQRVKSVFADVCPRFSSDEIQEIIFEEMLKLVNRKEIPSSMLDDPRVMISWDHLQQVCENILTKRDAYLREEYTKVLNLKLAEQHESLVQLINDQLHNQFKDAGDPSYLA